MTSGPIKNLRITLWGVQGSCPIFPSNNDVREFVRLIGVHTLSRTLEEIARSPEGVCSAEQLLDGAISPQTIEQFLLKLGQPEFPIYGGETTCLEVETADGNILLLDGGSGVRHCAVNIARRWKERKEKLIYVLGSHEHLDHRSGLPFARICFQRPDSFRIHIFGSNQFLSALDERYAIFSHEITAATHRDDPIDYRMMAASFKGTELRNPDLEGAAPRRTPPWEVRDVSEPIKIGNTTIKAFDVYHGNVRCLSYKIEHGGATFVFSTDHELRHSPAAGDLKQRMSLAADARLTAYCMNADVVYFDGQYFLAEYMGLKGIGSSPPVPRLDWGHGCIEDILERVPKCGIKRTYIGHHDPERDWGERIRIDKDLAEICKGKPYHIELAKSGTVIEL